MFQMGAVEDVYDDGYKTHHLLHHNVHTSHNHSMDITPISKYSSELFSNDKYNVVIQ